MIITAAQLDWMEHGARLLQARLSGESDVDPARRMTPAATAALKREISDRTAVLGAIYGRRPIPPQLHALAAFMQAKARLDLRRQTGHMNTETFLKLCQKLRDRREKEEGKAA